MSDKLRQMIRELIEEELDLEETTSSGAAGPFNTPFAFRGNSAAGKAKAKKNATVATGFEPVEKTQEKADDAGPQNNDPVSYGEKGKGGLPTPKKEKVVQEATSDAIKNQQEKIRNLKSERDEKSREASGLDALGKVATAYRKKIKKAEEKLSTLKSDASKKNESIVVESKYTDFKMSEGTPAQKIGKAIREISRQIYEVDRMLRMNERLKKESGSNSGTMWKSTAAALTKLEGRMNTMSTRIRNLKA